MAKYLVDTNLPYYFSLWRTDDYLFQRDFDPAAPDTEVWEYARRHELTIITKDRDYSDRILLTAPPPPGLSISKLAIQDARVSSIYIISMEYNFEFKR